MYWFPRLLVCTLQPMQRKENNDREGLWLGETYVRDILSGISGRAGFRNLYSSFQKRLWAMGYMGRRPASFILFCFTVCGMVEVTISSGTSGPKHKLSLWYRQSATNWMTSALFIGNGRISTIVFDCKENIP